MELFLAFVVALSVTAALIPLLARWAPAIGLTDAPGPRKVHSVPVPRVGGLAMAAGVMIPTVMSVSLVPEIRGLLLGLVVLLLFGVWDDRVTLGYRTKLAGQLLAVAICMLVGGVHVGSLSFAGYNVPEVGGTFITFVFLVGITNAVNLADGLDGLAGGMVLLCLSAISMFSAMSGNVPVTSVALIEAGAVLGFLRFNTHPARIFMGDSGSQMLGLSVGALSLLTTQGDTSALSAALPLLLLGLPIMDTLSVMLTRMRAGRSPFSADRNHVHHRLLALGFTHREAVLLIYLLQVFLVLLAFFLRFASDANVVLLFCAFAGVTLGLLTWAASSGWRLRRVERTENSQRPGIMTERIERLPAVAVVVMTSCLAAYAISVLASSSHVGADLGIACLGMLCMLIALHSWKAERSLQWFERAAAYSSVVMLVYLDQTIPHKPPLADAVSWTLIAVTGTAALVRFWLSPTRRFELTTLDLIVIFIAVVLPNLPGTLILPPVMPGGIAKAVVLLYVVEILLTVDFKRLIPRMILAMTFAAVATRAFVDFGT